MKKKLGNDERLDSYISSIAQRQRNTVWPDVLRGGRSVDEFLWKGARHAPLIQRIGVTVLAIAYLMMSVVFTSMAFGNGDGLAGVSAVVLFGGGGWFIRNAVRK